MRLVTVENAAKAAKQKAKRVGTGRSGVSGKTKAPKKPAKKSASAKGKYITAEQTEKGWVLLGTLEHPLDAKMAKSVATFLNMKKIEHKKRKIAGNTAVTLLADLTRGDITSILKSLNNMLKASKDMAAKAAK